MFQQQFILIVTVLIMSNLVLFDFSETRDWSGWKIENDVVMGGNSTSKLERSEEGNALFTGTVSLENNGGFASMQYHFASKDIKGYKKAIIRLKGDGKTYQFRTKSNLRERASYVYDFKTTGEWQTLEIHLKDMKPVYRGRNLDIPNFPAQTMQEIRFMIGNKKAENFRLEIDKIVISE